ncbi:MAG: ArsR/SmtB family transcription factor [Thermoleophilia bacterium]
MKATAQMFKALSDETRLRIIALLLDGELCVCELMAILGLPQSTVSRHLAYLKNSGLVDDRRAGKWMHYRLAADDGDLHADLLALLRQNLVRLPQVLDDRQRLKRFHSAKQASLGACAAAP